MAICLPRWKNMVTAKKSVFFPLGGKELFQSVFRWGAAKKKLCCHAASKANHMSSILWFRTG
jgi:hypothetical protein